MNSAHNVDHNRTVFIFVRWVPLAGFYFVLFFFLFKDWQHQPSKKKYSVHYGNENTSVKYSIDILWHLNVYFVCVPCMCMCVFLWMPLAHVHFSNLSDLCELTAEEANTHAAFSITYNREFLPFHLTTTLTTHWVSHTHSHIQGHTHTHRKYFTALSYAVPPPHFILAHSIYAFTDLSRTLTVCQCICIYVCVWKRMCVCTLKSFLFPCKWNAWRHNLKDYPKQRGRRRKLKERNFEWKKKVFESIKVFPALSFWRLLLVRTSFLSAYSYILLPLTRRREIGWTGARDDMAKGKTKTQVKPKKVFIHVKRQNCIIKELFSSKHRFC